MHIKIPVATEVYYFCLLELGAQPVLISAHNRHVIADKIYDLLTRPNRFQEYQHKEVYTNTLHLQLAERTEKICSFDLSEEKVQRFNVFVRQLIKDRLFLILDALWDQRSHPQRPSLNDIISQYIITYNLQGSGLTYDGLKKAYYRYRHSQQPRLVPTIAASVA